MKDGFFTAKETSSNSRKDGKVHSCASCGLYRDCRSPKMKATGNFQKGILNIGEAPGDTEDLRGKHWQGKTGRLLKKAYEKLGIDLFEDCLNINAVNCRPPSGRTPTPYEIDCCRKTILNAIAEYKPKVIVLLGGASLISVIGHRWKKDLGGIAKWRGWAIPDQDFKAWICPTFHPSFVIRTEKEVETIWMTDLKNAVEHLDIPFKKYREPVIQIIDDLKHLDKFKTNRVGIDYETTGLKPHAKGHRIVCASVAYNADCCYAFMMPNTPFEREPFTKLLGNTLVSKMAHNMKYEAAWSRVRLKQTVVNWEWDSMIAAHTLDNRPGITGLKFQTYVRFGVIDYSSEISPYLKATDSKNANAINRIMELVEQPGGKEKLLRYCALDTIFEFRLALLQMEELNYKI